MIFDIPKLDRQYKEEGDAEEGILHPVQKHHNQSDDEQDGEGTGIEGLRRQCPYWRKKFKSSLLNVWDAFSDKGSREQEHS